MKKVHHMLVLAFSVLLLTSCDNTSSDIEVNKEQSVPLSESSIYQLDSEWTTDNETKFQLSSLQGKIQILAMGYTSCEYTCPLTINTVLQIYNKLPVSTQSNVNMVFVTFDSDNDTPKELRSYRQKRKLDAQSFKLLQGSQDDTRELAVILGIKYKKMPGGHFSHSNIITILNEKGEIIHQVVGLNADITPAVDAILK